MRKNRALMLFLAAGLLCIAPCVLAENGGATWSARRRVTWTSASSNAPTLCIDSGNAIHLAWQDFTPGNYEIYYRNSADGATWSAAKRLTWTSSHSHIPAMAVDSGGAVHIVWQEDTPGNEEIYYRKGS